MPSNGTRSPVRRPAGRGRGKGARALRLDTRALAVFGLLGLFLIIALLMRQPAEAAPPQPPLKTTPDGRPLVLTFEENFDRLSLFDGRVGTWRTTFGIGDHKGLDRRSLPTNGELQLYVDPMLGDERGKIGLNPFSVQGGMLTIAANPTPPGLQPRLRNYAYHSGVLTTQPSFSQLYGYFEMRARLPRGKGMWPAFWMLPADNSWPPEIDIMESVGDPGQVYQTAHSKTRKSIGYEPKVSPNDFHVFAVAWDRDELVFFVDGRETGRQPTPADMHKPMFMLVNLAVGGKWPGAPDATTKFPGRYVIDYVRAYRFAR